MRPLGNFNLPASAARGPGASTSRSLGRAIAHLGAHLCHSSCRLMSTNRATKSDSLGLRIPSLSSLYNRPCMLACVARPSVCSLLADGRLSCALVRFLDYHRQLTASGNSERMLLNVATHMATASSRPPSRPQTALRTLARETAMRLLHRMFMTVGAIQPPAQRIWCRASMVFSSRSMQIAEIEHRDRQSPASLLAAQRVCDLLRPPTTLPDAL